MIHIDASKSFYDITKDNPDLRSCLVRFGFGPMKEDMAYQTIGKVMSLQKALEHITKTTDEFVAFAHREGMEVTFYE